MIFNRQNVAKIKSTNLKQQDFSYLFLASRGCLDDHKVHKDNSQVNTVTSDISTNEERFHMQCLESCRGKHSNNYDDDYLGVKPVSFSNYLRHK